MKTDTLPPITEDAPDESTEPPKKWTVADRWTPTLAKTHHTPVVNAFLDSYATKLDLTSQEALLVIHLMRYKWDSQHPFVKVRTLAERMRISARRIRELAASLEEKGCLKRHERPVARNRSLTNLYDLRPLFGNLESLLAETSTKQKK